MSYIGKKPTSSFASATSQTFTGNNSTTEFTLNRRVSRPEDLEVFVSNIQQQPTTSYTIGSTGLALNFDSAPPAGEFYVVYRNEAGTNAIDIGAARTANANTFSAAQTFSGGISGNTTFSGDATFTGDNYNVVWDKSENALEFADDAELRFGNSNDLIIRHQGTHSQIRDVGTGNLKLSGSQIEINNPNNTENMIIATENDAVKLYRDNSLKLSTATNGVEIYNGATGNTPTIVLKDMNSGVVGGDEGGGIYWYTNDGNGQGNNASIRSVYQNAAGGTALLFGTGTGSTRYDRIVIREGGKVSVGDQTGGAGLYVTNTYDYGYSLHVNNSTTQQLKGGVAFINPDVGDASTCTNIFHQPNRFGWSMFYCNKIIDGPSAATDNRYFDFYWSTTTSNTKGTIKYNYGSGVMEYNTTSDYRLKDNIQDANISTLYEDMKKVKVRTFHMKEDHDPEAPDTIGLIAHEAQEIWSQVCDKPKDAMKDDVEGRTKDADGNPAKIPDYQELDYGKFTPMIMGALQKAMEKIETLEAKVAELESK